MTRCIDREVKQKIGFERIGVVIAIVIATNCNHQANQEPEITESQRDFQREFQRRESTKLMPPGQHSMKVPLGTQIGDTITCYDGLWISEWGCQRMAAVLKMLEEQKEEPNN